MQAHLQVFRQDFRVRGEQPFLLACLLLKDIRPRKQYQEVYSEVLCQPPLRQVYLRKANLRTKGGCFLRLVFRLL